MDSIQLTFMEHSDIPACARVLSEAMLSNPLHEAVFLGTGERERRLIEGMFLDLFSALPAIVYVAKEKSRIVGVMRMKSCQGRPIPDVAQNPEDETDPAWRKSVWHAEWARRDPSEQHWHLGPIGVLPPHQGTGVGSLFMQRFCAEVDACGATAYLETDLTKNVRFYEKFGFRLIEESDIFGVTNRYMTRPVQG
ncbi:MAG: N-acetyltransferase [Desulfovibrio sp.]|nr:MAG: N-acetyltransferase [Desulfovibrio sp.]